MVVEQMFCDIFVNCSSELGSCKKYMVRYILWLIEKEKK